MQKRTSQSLKKSEQMMNAINKLQKRISRFPGGSCTAVSMQER